MRLATCGYCSHPIVFAETLDDTTVTLERHESAAGPNRFAIWDDGFARPVTPSASVLAYEVHLCEGLKRYRRDSSPRQP